jgi:hypothetical protein
VIESVDARDRTRGVNGLISGQPGIGAHAVEVRTRLHVSSSGERARIGGVLLVASLEEDHADVECKRGDEHDEEERAREQDQDLALARISPGAAVSC